MKIAVPARLVVRLVCRKPVNVKRVRLNVTAISQLAFMSGVFQPVRLRVAPRTKSSAERFAALAIAIQQRPTNARLVLRVKTNAATANVVMKTAKILVTAATVFVRIQPLVPAIPTINV